MKRVCLEQFIPQLFKLNSGLYPSFSTKNPNSFPKHYNSLVLNLSAPNQRRNGGQESLAARPRVFHKCGENLGDIQKDKALLLIGSSNIHATFLQSLKKTVPV